MLRQWELVIPIDVGDKAMREDGRIQAVYSAAMRSKRWERGDVLPSAAYGGFFVQVVDITQGPESMAWILSVRPLLGRTLVEILASMVGETLHRATGLEPVEIALHVAEFSRRAMEKARELEEVLYEIEADNDGLGRTLR